MCRYKKSLKILIQTNYSCIHRNPKKKLLLTKNKSLAPGDSIKLHIIKASELEASPKTFKTVHTGFGFNPASQYGNMAENTFVSIIVVQFNSMGAITVNQQRFSSGITSGHTHHHPKTGACNLLDSKRQFFTKILRYYSQNQF